MASTRLENSANAMASTGSTPCDPFEIDEDTPILHVLGEPASPLNGDPHEFVRTCHCCGGYVLPFALCYVCANVHFHSSQNASSKPTPESASSPVAARPFVTPVVARPKKRDCWGDTIETEESQSSMETLVVDLTKTEALGAEGKTAAPIVPRNLSKLDLSEIDFPDTFVVNTSGVRMRRRKRIRARMC